MKELNEYRIHLVERLLFVAKEFRDACLRIKEPFTPLNENGWNVHQIAAHTRDVNELVYGLRARRTVQEDNPQFQNFDGDAYMREKYDSSEPLGEMLTGFVKNTESLVEMLNGLPSEAWTRTSRHTTLGSGFTLQTWIERNLAHIEEHLEAVKKSL
jgi:hypothetical protein